MKDIFEQNSIRPNSQLLGATASVPNGHAVGDGLDVKSQEDFKSDAEGMVRHLVASKKPCLMVDSKWTAAGEAYAFPHKQAFIVAGSASGCVVHEMNCPDQGGTRHMVFLGRSFVVTDAEYLECLHASLPDLC
jgi:hypothetical protein